MGLCVGNAKSHEQVNFTVKGRIGNFHVSPICVLYSLMYKTSIQSHTFLLPFFVGLQVVAKNEVMFKGVNLKFLKPILLKFR